MSQQFEQREEQLSKKDFTIAQLEDIVSRLEVQVKLYGEHEVSTPYFEPVSSPEVDSLLNVFLRLNARLLNASNRIEFAESVKVDEIIKEKDEEIQTIKGELDVKSDEIERLESIVSEKVDEIGDLALEVINKDDEIETMKRELDMRSDQVEKLAEETEGYHKAIRDLELKVKELLRENEGLKASNTKKK